MSWIKSYREFTWDGTNLFCTACSKIIHADKKCIVDQHVKSAKHQLNVRKLQRGEPSQQTIQHCLEEKPKNSKQAQFNEDLCKAFIGANIPLKKLSNPNLSSFLTKYCKFNIPDESTVRKGSVDVLYKQTVNDIKKKEGENYFYLVYDLPLKKIEVGGLMLIYDVPLFYPLTNFDSSGELLRLLLLNLIPSVLITRHR